MSGLVVADEDDDYNVTLKTLSFIAVTNQIHGDE